MHSLCLDTSFNGVNVIIYIAFYEASDSNGKFLFKGHVVQNFTTAPTNGEEFMGDALIDAQSDALGRDASATEVVIVGITKL